MTKPLLWGLMLLMLVSGSLNSILTKLLFELSADGMPYRHPYFITYLMFIGEALCYLVYMTETHFSGGTLPNPSGSASRKSLIQRLGPKAFALPGFLDGVATGLTMVGLALTGVSIYQMLRGFLVAIVAVYSVLFLGMRLYRHQVVGVVVIVVGVGIVGVGSVWLVESHALNPGLGAFLILSAQIVSGWEFILEEKFFAEMKVPALEAVGIEGLMSMSYFALVLLLLYFIPCSDTQLCSGSGHVEDTLYAIKQLTSSWQLSLAALGRVVTIALFYWSSLTVTKCTSSLARSTIDTARTLLVWGMELTLGWGGFSYIQLFGFVLLALGTSIYNEVFVIPCLGFKEAVHLHQCEMTNRLLLADDHVDTTELRTLK